jgi:TPP-dependent 2-oxoacid decarboxylase
MLLLLFSQDAAHMIDEAILTALTERKPVYLEIPVNINSQRIPTPSPLSFAPPKKVTTHA